MYKLWFSGNSSQVLQRVKSKLHSLQMEFKQLIGEKSEIPADRQRLIYSGKVLKDNDTLETYKIAEGHTVHMVKSLGARASSQSQTSQSTTQSEANTPSTTNTTNNQSTQPQNAPLNPFAALGGFGGGGGNFGINNPYGVPNLGGNNNGPNMNMMMEQVLNNPALMQYASQMMQDPQFIDNIIAMNPQFGEMAPRLRQLTQDPGFQALLSNPDTIRYMATLNPSMNPGGYGMGILLNPAATMNPTGNPNTNQQQQQPFFQIDPSLLFGLGGLGVPPTTASTVPPEERFQVQLQQLNDMGFWDAQKNIRALLASGGNVNAAIEYLLNINE
nr:13670_t:CDS:2 [Entrophospora candida]CAG8514133.1 7152_t:CDS:2 [Entrophospora candida]